jgi:hypothetical protein
MLESSGMSGIDEISWKLVAKLTVGHCVSTWYLHSLTARPNWARPLLGMFSTLENFENVGYQ